MTAPCPSAAELDQTFVPRFKDPVTAVPVADEAVLYESDTGDMHRLDQIASVVCSLFDGWTSVEVAVDELAAVFAAPRDVIAADVLGLVRDLGRKGLLEGVQPGDPDGSTDSQPTSATPVPPAVADTGTDDGC